MGLIVYTAITDNYDVLNDPAEEVCAGAEFVAFVENSVVSRRWETRSLAQNDNDPKRRSGFYKILSHRVLPNAEFTLWIDGSIDLIMPFPITNLMDYLRDADLAIFEHSSRCCVYQEACEILRRHLDNPRTVYEQVMRYTRQGYPANMGLGANTVILRRHNKRIKAFNEAWWREIQNGSKRDQLSFNYVANKCGLKYNVFPNSLRRNSLFRPRPHIGSAVDFGEKS